MPHYIPSETVKCVHCGHEEEPHHQCTDCGGIPDDIDMPWEKLNPNAPDQEVLLASKQIILAVYRVTA